MSAYNVVLSCTLTGVALSVSIASSYQAVGGPVDCPADPHGAHFVSGAVLPAGHSLWAGAGVFCPEGAGQPADRFGAAADCALPVSDRL